MLFLHGSVIAQSAVLLVQIERFVKHKLDVCRWVGLAVLLVQLLSLGLAYALSAAQQKLLDVRCDMCPSLQHLFHVCPRLSLTSPKDSAAGLLGCTQVLQPYWNPMIAVQTMQIREFACQ